MSCEVNVGAVIQAGAPHCFVIKSKAGDADDVKRYVGGSAQPSDVAGVGWYLRFDERNEKHEHSIFLKQKETTSFA